MYIKRLLQKTILESFDTKQKSGLILSGIVGCGKTTLINECLNTLGGHRPTFRFTGDDTIFRAEIAQDSKYILNTIRAKTSAKNPLVFVDEVQKSENIFDAIKVAFDEADASFIISGSNPAYLNTVAKKRLQRRSGFLTLLPLSLLGLYAQYQQVDLDDLSRMVHSLLFESTKCKIPSLRVDLNADVGKQNSRFFSVGGLPLAHLAKSQNAALSEIQKVVERGFEPLNRDTLNLSDRILIELAHLHSKEFSYQGLFQKTGMRHREIVNRLIEDLEGHGYLVEKRPVFPSENRRSYLSVYSFIDPGIVSYLTADTQPSDSWGYRIEGYVHSRLSNWLSQIPMRGELGYFKEFSVDINGKTKFIGGEIDFILKVGKRMIPVEVKQTSILSNIDTSLLEAFVQDHKCPYGILVYGGAPFADSKRNLIFWPYWLL